MTVQIVGGVATLGAILWSALSQRKRLDHLDDCIDEVKEAQKRHEVQLTNAISVQSADHDQLVYLAGVIGIPFKEKKP